MLLTLAGCTAWCLEMEDEREDIVEVDILLRFTSESELDFWVRSNRVCFLSIELGDMDLRTCGTSTMDGFPENTTDTTLAVTSWAMHSFVGDGVMSSLPESYSKSEKSPAVEEASSSEERYSSWGFSVKTV